MPRSIAFRPLFALILLHSGLFTTAHAAEGPSPSRYGIYAGVQRNGFRAGLEWRKRNKSWLKTEADFGLAMGLKANTELKYANGVVEQLSVTSDLFPRAGASTFLSIPYGILRYIGVGLGIQGYYHSTEYRSREIGRTWIAKERGFHYNFSLPLISIGLEFPQKSGGNIIALEFDSTLWLGGPQKDFTMEQPGFGAIGGFTSHLMNGMHTSLTLHYLWGKQTSVEEFPNE